MPESGRREAFFDIIHGDYKHSGRRYAGGATYLLQGRTRALSVPTPGHRGVARGPTREEQS